MGLQRRLKNGVIVAVVTFAASVALLMWQWWRLEGSNPWGSWRYHPSPWCERERTKSLLRERSNTLSDLGFIGVGLFQIWCGYHDWLVGNRRRRRSNRHLRNDDAGESPKKMSSSTAAVAAMDMIDRNTVVRYPILSVVCGSFNVIHALGTMMYHACKCWKGQIADIAGMYCATVWPAFYVALVFWLRRDTEYERRAGAPSFKIAIVLSLYVSLYFGVWWLVTPQNFSEERRDLFMAICILASSTGVWLFGNMSDDGTTGGDGSAAGATTAGIAGRAMVAKRRQLTRRTILTCLGCFLFGFACNRWDKMKLWCDPDSWLQGHSMWHVVNILPLTLIYCYFRCEGVQEYLQQKGKSVDDVNGGGGGGSVLTLARKTFAI